MRKSSAFAITRHSPRSEWRVNFSAGMTIKLKIGRLAGR
jgi:hypothetical protein